MSKIDNLETKRRKTGGRKLGSQNKISLSVKDSILATFESLGGVEQMAKWAEEHQTDFYRIYAKLVPTQITDTRRRSIKDLSDDELMVIAAGKQ